MNATVAKSRDLVKAFKHPEAEKLLVSALEMEPDNPDLNAELGILYCFTQREFDAAQLLERSQGAERLPELLKTLNDYFHCRRQMADKLGKTDEKAVVHAQRVAQFQPPKPDGVGIKLSACLIVKNEEAHLERCLKSLQGIVDEVVVVDTGSTDRTIEIAESYGAVIGHFEWCDDFAAARNESLKLATGDWALWIDADEELTKESWNAIREALIRPQFGGYFIRIVNFMDEEGEANKYVHTPVRLFRLMPGMEFTGRIHEQILTSFEKLGLVPAALTNATLLHYGYQATTMKAKNKLKRTVDMLEREVKEHPLDPFHWFNLANAYSVGKQSENAERAARESIKYLTDQAPYAPVAFQILSSALIAQSRLEEALQVCQECEARGFNTLLNEFDRAHAYHKLRQPPQALQAIDRCLTMEWPDDLTGDFGIKTYKGHVLKSQILSQLGHAEEALALANYALGVDPNFPLAAFAKAVALERLGQYEEAAELFASCSEKEGLAVSGKLTAFCLLKANRSEDAVTVFRSYVAQNPQDGEGWFGWIEAALACGNDQEALSAYASFAENSEPDADVLVNWARILDRTDQPEHALQKLADAISKDPANVNAFNNCGDVLYRLGHFEPAAGMYEHALRLQPQNAQVWFVLGNCFAHMGVAEGAVVAYQQTLALQPDHGPARANLETVLAPAAA